MPSSRLVDVVVTSRLLLQPSFDVLPALLREAPVVARRPVGFDDAALAEVLQHALGARPRVREDERALRAADEVAEFVVERVVDCARGGVHEVRARTVEFEVVVAGEPRVDEFAVPRRPLAVEPDEEPGDVRQRFDRRRAADAGEPAGQPLEAFEAHREVGAALESARL